MRVHILNNGRYQPILLLKIKNVTHFKIPPYKQKAHLLGGLAAISRDQKIGTPGTPVTPSMDGDDAGNVRL
jgi:hypothetical protein